MYKNSIFTKLERLPCWRPLAAWWRHQWKHFPRYWSFVRGIHRWPVNSPHKGQWRGALMFSLIDALNERLSKQSWGWWFEKPSRSLWRHCNEENVEVYGGLYEKSSAPGTSPCWVNCHSHQLKLSLNEWFFDENILETMNFVAFQLSSLKIAQTAVYDTKHSVSHRFLTEMERSSCFGRRSHQKLSVRQAPHFNDSILVLSSWLKI